MIGLTSRGGSIVVAMVLAGAIGACSGSTSSGTPAPLCREGALRCEGNVLQVCRRDAWGLKEDCGQAQGVCLADRLLCEYPESEIPDNPDQDEVEADDAPDNPTDLPDGTPDDPEDPGDFDQAEVDILELCEDLGICPEVDEPDLPDDEFVDDEFDPGDRDESSDATDPDPGDDPETPDIDDTPETPDTDRTDTFEVPADWRGLIEGRIVLRPLWRDRALEIVIQSAEGWFPPVAETVFSVETANVDGIAAFSVPAPNARLNVWARFAGQPASAVAWRANPVLVNAPTLARITGLEMLMTPLGAEPPGPGAAFDACNETRDCGANLTCIREASPRYCAPACQPQAPPCGATPAGQSCGEGGLCRLADPAAAIRPGANRGFLAPCAADTECESGLFCDKTDPARWFCTSRCKEDDINASFICGDAGRCDAGVCRSRRRQGEIGDACQTVADCSRPYCIGGVCTDRCDDQPGTRGFCPAGMECGIVERNRLSVCLPGNVVSEKETWEECANEWECRWALGDALSCVNMGPVFGRRCTKQCILIGRRDNTCEAGFRCLPYTSQNGRGYCTAVEAASPQGWGEACSEPFQCLEPLSCWSDGPTPMCTRACAVGVPDSCGQICAPGAGGGSECREDGVCVENPREAGDGRCVPPEQVGTVEAGDVCEADYQCASGICIQRPDAPEGLPSGVCADPCSARRECDGGLECVLSAGGLYGCVNPERRGNLPLGTACEASVQCAQGDCVPLAFGRVCARRCDGGLTCPAGQTCAAMTTTIRYCMSNTHANTADLGEPCMVHADCRDGAFCGRFGDDGQRFCTRACESGAECGSLSCGLRRALSTDTRILLYGPDFRLFDFNDDGEPRNPFSRIFDTELPVDGLWYIEVTGPDASRFGAEDGAYELMAYTTQRPSDAATPEAEPNDGFESAAPPTLLPLFATGTLQAASALRNDRDFFAFALPSPTSVTVETRSPEVRVCIPPGR